MRRLPALAAVVLAVGLVTPGVSAQAQTMGRPDPVTPAPRVRPGPPYLPDAVRPVPIPHVRPHGAPPVPIPHARLRGPAPVPMPHVGDDGAPVLRLPPP